MFMTYQHTKFHNPSPSNMETLNEMGIFLEALKKAPPALL
jgi:hypothetical protein